MLLAIFPEMSPAGAPPGDPADGDELADHRDVAVGADRCHRPGRGGERDSACHLQAPGVMFARC